MRVDVPPSLGISVVIPVLDEELRIGERLMELGRMAGIVEVIVVDGGSRDRTAEIIRSFPEVRLVSAPRGRGSQMNAGARIATGEVLLFLHADVRLPLDAATWVGRVLEDPAVVAGAFRTWTVPDAGRSWVTPLLHLADLRSRFTRLPYGDQALFVRRDVFERVGGFPDQPLMEDLELSLRLRRVGRIATAPATVRVSGRRFLVRPIRSAVQMRLFPLLYRLGVPPGLLARLYGDPR
ncbi:MAG TPA: TIGR04283 family arsenosugar biosynthesis glycosyltransferase [Candidatus Binatus sp.]|nr:TIGR04283 family arsenosugar biosynthesis glycosyltransferase [Candidatus Binatus sp.]